MKNILIMKKILYLLVLIGLFSTGSAYGQQEPMYGQYVFNNSVLNPAQAGAENFSQWGVLSRFQFIGIDGAPMTNSAYANLQLPRQLGLAVGLYHDQLGIEEHLQLQADLAYHARLSDTWRLSGGIRVMASNHEFNFRELDLHDPGDPFFEENVTSGILLNAGAGLLLSSQRSFFGISMPRVFVNDFQVYDPGDFLFFHRRNRHMFAYAGTNIPMSDSFTFMPSTLFKYADDAPVQFDLNAIFNYRNTLSFGPLVRSNLADGWLDAVGFLVGLSLGEHWYFGYIYEYPTHDLNKATKQTHEISLRYRWGMIKDRFRSPRYFY